MEEDGKIVQLSDYHGETDFYTTTAKETYLVVGGKKTLVTSIPDPTQLPWKDLNVDIVLECTGRYVEGDAALDHLKAGAKKVVVSAPTKGGTIPTFVLGANQDQYLGQNAFSNASCTTNCTSPVVSIIHSKFKVLKAMLTTVHALTSGQNLVDGPPNPRKPDLREGRAAGFNMVPTSTGAAKATVETIPDLKGKFDGVSIRVPIITGSITDIVMLVEKKTTVEEINQTFIEAKENPIYKGVLDATWEPIVSSDIIKSHYSAIVDLAFTRVVDGDLVKVMAWYDNEWGYSNRLVEIAILACE
ncbi:hypothetical protein A2602_02820 [candidate division WWE3 bacterium RIFOXYD1_FULL_40_11]|nr:MAG: hypothetical protein A2602_02820 [candidate division WWE3 bacterium RIFOXYD1_FULL_40_11]